MNKCPIFILSAQLRLKPMEKRWFPAGSFALLLYYIDILLVVVQAKNCLSSRKLENVFELQVRENNLLTAGVVVMATDHEHILYYYI